MGAIKLAVTGGAGFLGYHICHQLADKYEKIYVLDIVPIDPKEYPANVRFLQVDVRDQKALNGALKDIDSVIHAAAALPLWKKEDIFAVNVGGTRNILEAAINNGVKKTVFVSSTAVYGLNDKHPSLEDDVLYGVGPYGESKVEAEKICQEYRKKGACVSIVRPKSIVGTGRLGVFQILYDWIESGKRIPIIGNGKNRFQLLEVEDLVDAIYLLLMAPHKKANDTFNVGAADFGTVNDDLSALCAYAASGARVLRTPKYPVIFLLALLRKMGISPLYKWIYMTAANDSFVSIAKLRDSLGWSPRCSNIQAIVRSYQWYLDHKDGLRETGITHRVPWDQGILRYFKRFL